MQTYFKENKYLKIYISLCNRAKQRASTKTKAKEVLGYIESHHIIPRSFDMSVSKSKNNIAHLTAREHFIAHKLIILIAKKPYELKAKQAIRRFLQANSCQKRILTSRDYEYVRKICVECCTGANSPMYGKRGTVLNKVLVNNGAINKFVDKDVIPTGWVLGAKERHKMIGITNGIINERILKNEPIPRDWWKGSITKGRQSKMKGTIQGIRSNEWRESISKSKQNIGWITDGVNDKTLRSDEVVPDGWRKGRTHGANTKLTENRESLLRSLKIFGFISVGEAKETLSKEVKAGQCSRWFINKYKKTSDSKNQDPKILSVLSLFNLVPCKGKPGPKTK